MTENSIMCHITCALKVKPISFGNAHHTTMHAAETVAIVVLIFAMTFSHKAITLFNLSKGRTLFFEMSSWCAHTLTSSDWHMGTHTDTREWDQRSCD